MAAEAKVLMQVSCDQCDGIGRIPWNPGVTGGHVLGTSDKPCPECGEKGYVVSGVSLSDLRGLLGEASS
jgi:DnaJ-class molecular chaperone